MENDADCFRQRANKPAEVGPIKSEQAVGAGGFLTSIKITLQYLLGRRVLNRG
ncbi:hypothetical protein GGD38_001151 [Chitinophagaceae bacterium OAS944]|nr:hypothetical protein [Chitinophagaceae bacterium OAS944]